MGRQMGNKVGIEDAQFISRAGRDIVTETVGREVGAVGSAIGQAVQDNMSPLKSRQMANKLTVEDAAFISRAGRDIVTETIGQEIGAVGQAIGAALEGAKERSKARKAKDAEAVKAAGLERLAKSTKPAGGDNLVNTNGIGDRTTGLNNPEDTGKTEGAMPAPAKNQSVLDSLNIGGMTITRQNFTDFGKKIASGGGSFVQTPKEVEKQEQTSGGGLPSYEEAWNDNLEGVQDSYPNKAAYLADKATKGKETEARRAWAEKNLPEGETYNEAIHGAQFKSAFPRRKDNSPFSRQRQGADDLASMYAVNIGGRDISGSTDESQYQEGKTYVEKERKLSGASFMGSAAIEGYNLAVEGRNYDKQVQADTEDYFNEMTAGLNPERTGIDYLDQSLNELGNQRKREYAAHQKDRAAAIREGRKTEWDIRNKELTNFASDVLNAKDNIVEATNAYKEGIENGTIDSAASDSGLEDLYNTFLRGGSILGVVDLGDGMGASLAGATRGGEGVQMSLTTIAQQLQEKSFVKKQDPMEFYNEFTANIKTDKIPGVEKQYTVDANGNKITKYNTDQLGRVLDVYIKEELKETNSARGYGSALLNLDHRQYNEMVKDPESDPKGLIAAKMKEDMMNILAPMQNYRSEESTGLSTALVNARAARQARYADLKKQGNSTEFINRQAARDIAGSFRQVFSGGRSADVNLKPGEGITWDPNQYSPEVVTTYNKELEALFTGAKGISGVSLDPLTGELIIEGKIALDSEKDALGNYQDKPAETLETIPFADKTEKEKEQIISNLMKSYGVNAVGGNVTSRQDAVNAVQIANETNSTSNKN
jgi:hypothetical protein